MEGAHWTPSILLEPKRPVLFQFNQLVNRNKLMDKLFLKNFKQFQGLESFCKT